MPTHHLVFPWGDTQLSLDLPEGWQVTEHHPAECSAVPDAAAETQRALAQPFGSPLLEELAAKAKKVALVIDDASRPTPVAKILPVVMAALQAGGVQPEQVTVIPALGLHRAMTREEASARLGGNWLERMIYEVHECDNPEKLKFIGTTRFGTPVWVNKTVAEADLVISIGCIEPHLIASFGGGYKNLFPGVAGRGTIAHNHSLNCSPNTFNMVGQPIEKNPMRLDLEESGEMVGKPVFIVNAVLNARQEVVEIVAGNPIAAHRAGVCRSSQIFGVKVPGAADVVITASRPMDQDLRQGVKALGNTILAMKPGGVMINLVRAEEGVGVFGLANKKLPLGKNALRALAPAILPLVPKLKLKGMGEEDKFFLYFALQAMRRGTLLLYAPTIPQSIHENLPFVSFVQQAQQAVDFAAQHCPPDARVLVLPYGGSTYPIL